MLSFYVVTDWREGCERCKQILRYGGMGHTMSIHSRNDDVILQFGLKKPAFRIVVNTPTTLGSIGLTTGLDPSMTLGCGGYGGNITSDNISPRHLLNIKRLAYETSRRCRRARPRRRPAATAGARLPKAPRATGRPPGIAAASLARGSTSSWRPAATRATGAGRQPTGRSPRRRPSEPDPAEAGSRPRRRRRSTVQKAGRLRLRRRRPAGGAAGPQDCRSASGRSSRRRPGTSASSTGLRQAELAPLSGADVASC